MTTAGGSRATGGKSCCEEYIRSNQGAVPVFNGFGTPGLYGFPGT